ncbi:hypothetical protein JAAARDRAFT_32355 [Jaapia argillacea MUCL 33604]|uniref:Uncharacterized protein n=1 Tax=Jaapia argillacea MUCL 33604 TaxID=933084 RepID=A0A067QBN1_9AGAM|nr:hypothetical protein JAAARDRAFT_32355 [Jaapia argillacea MUCL 33604]
MPVLSASIDAFLLTSLAIIIPAVYYSRKSNGAPSSPVPPFRKPLSVLVLLHSLYVLYKMILHFPPNLFMRMNIPLTMPSDEIRARLLRLAGMDAQGQLPPSLETLISRLSSFDARTVYVRFGQAVIQNCDYCQTPSEYALHALPTPLLQYIRAAAVVGLVTIVGSYRERWRMYGIAAIVCSAVVEAYIVLTVQIKIPRSGRDVVMWHDTMWLIRHLLFLALPPVIHVFLPANPPTPPPLATLSTVASSLDQTFLRLHLLRYLQGASLRVPEFRDRKEAFWETQRQEGTWGREDENVRRIADRLGLGYDERGVDGEGEGVGTSTSGEGRLRTNARVAVEGLKNGLRRNTQ